MRGGLLGELPEAMLWPSDTPPPLAPPGLSPLLHSDVTAADASIDEEPQVACEYKEVVIVGNGPSGISLSYLLSGNWPYYGDVIHPLDFLHQRLEASRHVSLILQDLRSLSDGLEGRSNNPVSILFDSLIHPDADLGVENPSCLRWTRHRDKVVDHVVLGKGMPGGAWQNMEQSALTLSLNNWMELPELEYKAWEQELLREHHINAGGRQSRATVGNVAKYYNEYVHFNRLDDHFRNHCTVTSVRPLTTTTSTNVAAATHEPLDDTAPPTPTLAVATTTTTTIWEVRGHSGWSRSPFRYRTPHLVLATGSHDLPNRLHVPGEDLPFVMHSAAHLEALIAEQRLGAHSDPLLIVGAGLTAADTVITARFYGVPVAHVFRRHVDDRSLIFNKLPENMYPEYHKVHQMMRNSGQGYSGSYRSYAGHRVVEMLAGNKVRLEGAHAGVVLRVSHVVILIGSRPDLSFLSDELVAQLSAGDSASLGGASSAAVRVDAFTHESVNVPGLFALGPLVGDNFVRFLQGGALAAASHLVKVVLGKKVATADEVCATPEGATCSLDGMLGAVAARRRSCSFDRPSWVYKSWQTESSSRDSSEGDMGGAKSEVEGGAEDGGPARRLRATPKRRQHHRRRLFSHSSCDRLNL